MATTLALRAFDGFAGAVTQPEPAIAAYRAMGLATQAFAAAYPLAAMLPPVNRFYLEPEVRDNAELQQKLMESDPDKPNVGVMHADNAADSAVAFQSMCRNITKANPASGDGTAWWQWAWPTILVVLASRRALRSLYFDRPHIGGTNVVADELRGGQSAAVRFGCLCAAALERGFHRMLLTGMSDGGTFSYVSGLQSDSPFTHLAPCSASFHPMLLEVVDPARLQGLPIYLMHGVLDWMFPVSVAREGCGAESAGS